MRNDGFEEWTTDRIPLLSFRLGQFYVGAADGPYRQPVNQSTARQLGLVHLVRDKYHASLQGIFF